MPTFTRNWQEVRSVSTLSAEIDPRTPSAEIDLAAVKRLLAEIDRSIQETLEKAVGSDLTYIE